MNRRTFLQAATAAAPLALNNRLSAEPPRAKMGIATTSYMTYAKLREPLAFLDHCHALGAAGVQVQLPDDAAVARQVRAKAEQLGMYVEAMAAMPKSTDTAPFEAALRIAQEAGAVAVRTGTTGGRRYEKWTSLAEWKAFTEESTAAIKKIAPIAERMKMPVGMENHKDWTIAEQVALMKQTANEYFGSLLDFGNNIALLDSPESILDLVPYVKMCHVKDMAVEPWSKGFLLSEVPLGEGILDLKKIVAAVRAANPKVRFSLEMITRDPLEVPCLEDSYWITFPDRNGRFLARTLSMVAKESKHLQPLVRFSRMSKSTQLAIEEENVKICLHYGRESLGL
jgi:sugar phosphate isomerase/epimerase